jgi:hypothetical protein
MVDRKVLRRVGLSFGALTVAVWLEPAAGLVRSPAVEVAATR